uniref:Uncharacterized protein n=1 Tax=Arundo donax TaxID=35708 RepID=A0A0A8YFK6_ARUDO
MLNICTFQLSAMTSYVINQHK